MTQITLVLPFALPPPELAPDLLRALNAPALAALLSRASGQRTAATDEALRTLPHESWLARALGLSSAGQPAFARAAMRHFGIDAGEGVWHIVNPIHIEIARSHLTMSDPRQLALSDAHSRALFDAAKPYFDDIGKTLLYGDAHSWFLRADSWSELDTTTPDLAVGMNLTDWLPTGTQAVDYRKLQNEVQMLWYAHPVNAERESAGLAAVNGFWPWAAAAASPASLPALETFDTAGPISALASLTKLEVADIARLSKDTIVYCDSLSGAALGADWAGWLTHMQRLDETVFAPALAALMDKRMAQLTLVLTRRDCLREFTTSKMAQRQFWRRPTLDRLLP